MSLWALGALCRYLGPVVSGVSGQGTFQAKTDGGQVVQISGSEFGSAADTAGRLVVTYGPPFNPSRFIARGCAVDFDFNSALATKSPTWVHSFHELRLFSARSLTAVPPLGCHCWACRHHVPDGAWFRGWPCVGRPRGRLRVPCVRRQHQLRRAHRCHLLWQWHRSRVAGVLRGRGVRVHPW